MTKPKRTAEMQAHWDRVRRLGCMVTGRQLSVTLHHCHSGSMADAGVNRGLGQKVSDWLVIPLDAELHIGRYGIDGSIGVRTWERRYGRQADYLDRLCDHLRINLWHRAGISRPNIEERDYA